MIIPLDDKTRIRGTETHWQFEEFKPKGEWRPLKYYLSFGAAPREAAQRELRTIPAHGIAETINACNQLTQKYAQIFDDVGRRSKVAA